MTSVEYSRVGIVREQSMLTPLVHLGSVFNVSCRVLSVYTNPEQPGSHTNARYDPPIVVRAEVDPAWGGVELLVRRIPDIESVGVFVSAYH